jgi:thiol:disulfide interchange protein DsbD
MKKLLSSILLLLTLSTISFAQKVNPAKWTWSLSKPNPEVGETVDVIFTVSIQKDWYLYSSDFDPDLGPTVTTIKFTPNDSYETVGS